MTLLYCFWVYTRRMLYSSTEILTHPCSLLHCSQQQENKASLDVLQRVMKIWHISTKECYVGIKRNYSHKSTGKWMELERIV